MYCLALLLDLAAVHSVFYVSMLKKYVHNPKHVVNYHSLDGQRDLSYENAPTKILERKAYALRNKKIALVKIEWKSHRIEEATWKKKEKI